MGFGISDLSPTYVGSGLYPTLDRGIVQVAMQEQVARQLFGEVSLVGKGNAHTFMRQSANRRVSVARVGEKAKISFISHPYTYVVARPYKVGYGCGVSHEVIEDQDVDAVVDQMTRAGILLGNTMDVDGMLTLLASSTGDLNVCGKHLNYAGAEIKFVHTIGQYDMLNGKAVLKQLNFRGDTLVTTPDLEAALHRLPMYANNEAYGNNAYQTGVWSGAQFPQPQGKIEGLDVFVTNNAVTNPTGTGALTQRGIIASRGGTNPMGQYSPLGKFVNKRPPSTRPEEDNSRDMTKTYITTRYTYVVLNNNTYRVLADLGTTTDGTAPLT